MRALRSPGDRLSLRVDVRGAAVCAALGIVTVAVAAVTLATGDLPLGPGKVLGALLGRGSLAAQFVVLDLRLPRLLTAVLAGAALGGSGAVFQALSHNPLGSPDLIGVTTGAASGALLTILVLGGGAGPVAAGAILGGLAAATTVYLLAWRRGVQGSRLILVGIGIAAWLLAWNSFLLVRADLDDAQHAAAWLAGTLDGRGWEHVLPLGVALALLTPLVLARAPALRLLEMGDEAATGRGVRAEATRLQLLALAVGLAAAATAAAGPISFVALAAPQLARRLTRAPGAGVPSSMCMGALLLAASDLGAQRAFGQGELPVGVVTFVTGGAYLAWVLARRA